MWKKDAFDCAGIRTQVFRLPWQGQQFQTQLINLNRSFLKKNLFSTMKIWKYTNHFWYLFRTLFT